MSDVMAADIACCEKPLRVWGTYAEIYAISFDRVSAAWVRTCLEFAIEAAYREPREHGAGKLWALVRALYGKDLTEHRGLPEDASAVNAFYNEMLDIDTWEMYEYAREEFSGR